VPRAAAPAGVVDDRPQDLGDELGGVGGLVQGVDDRGERSGPMRRRGRQGGDEFADRVGADLCGGGEPGLDLVVGQAAA
jgi:hypothetical protein